MKKSLRSFLLLVIIVTVTGNLYAQKRYLDQVFTSATKSLVITYDTNRSVNLLYGAPAPIPPSYSSSPFFTDNLQMDVYQPSGDTASKRPLIILVHTGSYLPAIMNNQTTGSRNDSNIVEMCVRFAKMGYVSVAMDNRMGWNPQTTVQADAREQLIKATYRAIQDARAVIRYMRKNASTYKVDTSKIICGGQGTGGYVVLGLGTIDKRSKIESNPKFLRTDFSPMVSVDTLGDWTGKGGVPFFHYGADSTISAKAHMIFNFGGAMGDSSWLDANSLPLVALHCTTDPFAPFNIGNVIVPTTGVTVIANATGANINVAKANSLGINNKINSKTYTDPISVRAMAASGNVKNLFPFYTLYPGEASPWEWWDGPTVRAITSVSYRGIPLPSNGYKSDSLSMLTNPNMTAAKARAYIDTIIGFVAPRIVVQFDLDVTTAVTETSISQFVDMFPNPAKDVLNISIANSGKNISSVEIVDIVGRNVITEKVNSTSVKIDISSLNKGVYFVRIVSGKGDSAAKKLVVE